MPHGLTDRMWRKQTSWCWDIVPKPERTGEICPIILLDGIGIGSLVCLIARTPEFVIGWTWVGWESSHTWAKLLAQFPRPTVVVCDGQKGILLAIARCWPQARVQRCIFHVWQNIRVKLTLHPQTEAGRELLQLTRDLWQVKVPEQATHWQERLETWHKRYESFVRERTYIQDPKPTTLVVHPWQTEERLLPTQQAAAGQPAIHLPGRYTHFRTNTQDNQLRRRRY